MHEEKSNGIIYCMQNTKYKTFVHFCMMFELFVANTLNSNLYFPKSRLLLIGKQRSEDQNARTNPKRNKQYHPHWRQYPSRRFKD